MSSSFDCVLWAVVLPGTPDSLLNVSLIDARAVSYYPIRSNQVSDNHLFGMYHANTPPHNKDVILQSLQKEDGVVRVVFQPWLWAWA